jgi:hypothetical protein
MTFAQQNTPGRYVGATEVEGDARPLQGRCTG